MIRKLLASTAMLALMTAGSFSIAQAQDEPAQTQEPAAIEQDATAGSADTAAASEEEKLTPEQPTIATAFIGKSVFSSAEPESDNIGEVNDLIISQEGDITHAVIGVGGFLGIGEKSVAVPFEELQVVEQDGEIRLVYASTKESLEAAEEFDRTAYDPSARFAEEQAAMQPDPAAPAGGMAPAAGTDPAATPAPDVAVTEEPAADATAEQDMAATEEPAADATAEEDMAATEEPAADATAEEDMAATEEPAADATADVTAEADPAAEADATAETSVAAGEAGFLEYNEEAIRASTMLGREVFGAEEESIGEISDLVLQEDGDTRAAIIDVGGFLGVGEKSVAIPFDQIEVQPQEDGEPRLTVAMTREELEAAPAFEGLADQDMAATDAPADGTEPDAAVTAEAPAADATAPDATATAEAPAADATAPDATADGEDMVAGTEAGAGYELATQDLSAEELMGSTVYGSGEENIGEVGDVIFTSTGDIEAVVVDVGGFLGMGEKPVAVEFDALNVQKDTNGDIQLMINASQEQLESAPAFQGETAAVQ